jgi:hypothetical protein
MLANTRRSLWWGIMLFFVWCLVFVEGTHGQGLGETNGLDGGLKGFSALLASSWATSDDSGASTTDVVAFRVRPLTLNLLEYFAPSDPAMAVTPLQTSVEIKQKIVHARNAKDYVSVLEYAEIGLTDSPWDLQLREAKGIALAKLHHYRAAIAVFQDAVLMETNDVDLVTSLAELLLINGEVGEYQALKLKHKAMIESAYDGLLSKYFDVLGAYSLGNEDQLRSNGVALLTALRSTGGSRLSNWDFEELLYVTRGQQPSRKKILLLTVVRVLMGELERDRGIQLLKSP